VEQAHASIVAETTTPPVGFRETRWPGGVVVGGVVVRSVALRGVAQLRRS
jgi:hypothetical protein